MTNKENKNNEPATNKPLYRVTFSRFIGKDQRGQDILSYPREIGAVWQRKETGKGAILELDLIPTDLVNRNGVIFLMPNDDGENGGEA